MNPSRPRHWFVPSFVLVPIVLYVLSDLSELLPRSTSERSERDSERYVGSEVCKGCHETQYTSFRRTVHAVAMRKLETTDADYSCERCHGPGGAHVDGGGDVTRIQRFVEMSARERTDVCLTCHAKQDERVNFKRSEHNFSQVSCDGCHSSHAPKFTESLLKEKTPDLCYQCHREVRSSFALPFRHKVPEGVISCIDCHNQHGGFASQKRMIGTDLACFKCHGDKQGPFTFEHIAVRVEGCLYCHTPHGSNNPRLLTRNQVHSLCLECHSGTGQLPAGEETPRFHNIATTRFQNCTTCHVQIHGSNLSPVFFE